MTQTHLPAIDEADTADNITSLSEEAKEYTPLDLYNNLLIDEELIFTIPAEQEEALRRGLISVKGKENQKLKDQGHPTDTSTLNFSSKPSKDIEGAVEIHVTLQKKKTLTVLDMKKPEGL